MNIFDLNVAKYELWYEKNKFEYLSEIEALKKVISKIFFPTKNSIPQI